MNQWGTWWSRMGLQFKLQILIQCFLLFILVLTQFWLSDQIEQRAMKAANDRAVVVGDSVINTLNTLMSAQVGDEDVIADPKVRKLFLEKMGVSDNIKELRVIRAKGTSDEFGPGLKEEQPVDAVDQEVLTTGKPVGKVVPDANGSLSLRTVMPFIAMKEFRGSRCLGCHGVDEGAVLGAVSVVLDISKDEAAIRQINRWLWLGQFVLQIALFFVIRTIVHRQLAVLGAEPRQAVELAQRVASGDLTTPVPLAPGDSQTMMAQLDNMQSSLSALVQQVRTGSDGVAIASSEIAQGNNELSNRTEQQASALQVTAAAMQQLGTIVTQNVDSAQQASTLAAGAADIAGKGGAMVGQMVSTMREINESSHQIADIISVIDAIAFQTNILALNAAVEAARAGEQGRGFAVVAAEVRQLAGRSAQAAKEISALINTSVGKVEHGTQVVNHAGATMQEIVQSVQRVATIMAEITAASHVQAQGVRDVGVSIAEMDDATQRNAALVEEMAAAAKGLHALAQDLVKTVAVFKVA